MATLRSFALVVLLVAAVGSKSPAQELTQEQRRELAHRIVVESARIQPHELVVIRGNAVFMPLIEDLALEASKVGGYAVMMPTTDSFVRSVLTEVPDQYLGQHDPTLAWMKNIDVFIDLPDLYNEPEVLRDIPQSKSAKIMGTGQDDFRIAVRDSKARAIFIDAPLPGQADLYGYDAPSFSAMQWAAVGADRSGIERTGKALADALKSARTIHVTTPDGTDFTFKTGSQAPVITGGVTHPEAAKWDDRNASLPAGSFAAAVAPGTFQGKIITPEDYCPGLIKLTGVSYEFSAGKMTGSKAQENDKCLQDYFAAYSGSKDLVASIQIGLNPALKTQSKTAPQNTAGMFWVFLGRDDRFGATGTQMNWTIPVANATVSVDGHNIIENGQLRPQ